MDFSKKVALITGGAGGIGKGCVEELLKSGIKGITIADINETLGEATTKELTNKFGSGKVTFVKTDVTSKDSFEGAFKKTIENFGGIDILINNAGLMNEINWEISLQVNLGGPINGILLAVEKYFPKYKGSEKAYIINISSIGGITPIECCPIYSATKHALIGLTRSYGINRHLIKDRIYVMTLCPSATDTPMIQYKENIARYKDIYEEAHSQAAPHLQKVDAVGKAAVKAIINPDSGSAWFIENGVIYKIRFPSLQQLIGSE